LKTFPEKLRLYQGLWGYLNTFFSGIELFQSNVRFFPQCLCDVYKTFCRGGILVWSFSSDKSSRWFFNTKSNPRLSPLSIFPLTSFHPFLFHEFSIYFQIFVIGEFKILIVITCKYILEWVSWFYIIFTTRTCVRYKMI
jgi:hypothetical protein